MFINLSSRVKAFFNDTKGITAIEYALIGVAMATALALILGSKDGTDPGTLTHALKGSFDAIGKSISNYSGN
ncbi:Flp family type IVb pilin [Aeromonas finlandensis]|uniref:Flp family type IVb pilin n=1 Tax=Aeromonas finlandensis TaxID=1543375 RepID=UPI00067AC5BA|nr:Flp family type IVb pilin [Aeromonas finlandensis]